MLSWSRCSSSSSSSSSSSKGRGLGDAAGRLKRQRAAR
jgi:hypothetical protein